MGALVYSIGTSISEDLPEFVDADCWGSPMRVGAGNSLRVDETLGYCAPYVRSRAAVSSVSLEIAFVDDGARSGTIRADAPVIK